MNKLQQIITQNPWVQTRLIYKYRISSHTIQKAMDNKPIVRRSKEKIHNALKDLRLIDETQDINWLFFNHEYNKDTV